MLLFWIHLSKETWEAIAVMTDNAAMLQKKDKYKTENGKVILCQDLAQNKMRSSATKLLTENRPSHTFFRSR